MDWEALKIKGTCTIVEKDFLRLTGVSARHARRLYSLTFTSPVHSSSPFSCTLYLYTHLVA